MISAFFMFIVPLLLLCSVWFIAMAALEQANCNIKALPTVTYYAMPILGLLLMLVTFIAFLNLIYEVLRPFFGS